MATSYVLTRGGRTRIPHLVYGTAWKKERTADLVYQALAAGFRGIDTAAQPRHYREDLVAEGVRRALADGVVASRADIYIQTKYTPISGQDREGPTGPPYDPATPLAEQVRASVESSLRNFTFGGAGDPPYLDCLVLHSPMLRRADTVAVWTALQAFVPDRIRSLGVSNVALDDLQELVEVAHEVAAAASNKDSGGGGGGDDDGGADSLVPVVVQNRFYRHRHTADPHDVALRRYCGHPDRRIVYESFWTLTANRDLLQRAACVRTVAAGAQVAPEVALYSLVVLGLGAGSCPMVVLDGTTSTDHMAADLAGLAQVEGWRRTGQPGNAAWLGAVTEFRQLIGDAEQSAREKEH